MMHDIFTIRLYELERLCGMDGLARQHLNQRITLIEWLNGLGFRVAWNLHKGGQFLASNSLLIILSPPIE